VVGVVEGSKILRERLASPMVKFKLEEVVLNP
jgi:hypothetical protein